MILRKQQMHKLTEYLSKGRETTFHAVNLNSGKGQKTIKVTFLMHFL